MNDRLEYERLRDMRIHHVVLDENELRLVISSLRKMKNVLMPNKKAVYRLNTLLLKLEGDYETSTEEDAVAPSDNLGGGGNAFERRASTSTPTPHNQPAGRGEEGQYLAA